MSAPFIFKFAPLLFIIPPHYIHMVVVVMKITDMAMVLLSLSETAQAVLGMSSNTKISIPEKHTSRGQNFNMRWPTDQFYTPIIM